MNQEQVLHDAPQGDPQDSAFADALHQLLVNECTPQTVRAIEAGPASGAPNALWRQLEASGFADALVPEAAGGAGLRLPEVFALFELCGRHALPLPLAETMLARAVLAEAGLPRPEGSIALAYGVLQADGGLLCDTVRCGRVADRVLAVEAGTGRSWLLPVAQAEAAPAAFCLDATLAWPAALRAAAPQWGQACDVRTLQGCVYAAQLGGALMQVFESTLQYANDRQQFGRSIGKFQAIQHQLAVIAEHAFAARMAARLGCQAPGALPQRLQVAVAKARASEAALEVAALAHSIHGAIGFTEEFDLQLFTRRLHLWRQAGGAESYWHDVAGRALVEQHAGLALDLIRQATDVL